MANAAFVAEFRDHVSGAAAVVFEHPYLAPLTELLPADARVVYSSLNVESDLKAQMLQPRRNGERYAARAAALERTLLLRADLIVCVSEQDRARFMAEFPGKNFAVVENGACFGARDESPFANDRTADASPERRLAVFIGSGHMPNVHAATFLLASVAPAVPNVTFVIIGEVCDAIGRVPRPANAVLVGALSANEKDALLRRATIALNPLVEGGGSSLKVPDFFSAGLPLVSTAVGVRGYDLQPSVHYVAAEPESFADAVRMLAHDAELRRRLARCAYDYGCTRLDWRALATRYRRRLRELIEPEARPRVLVTTYRFADPPPGGAESFLVNMLRQLHRRGNLDLDVATCDVGLISNRWHFSAEYGAADANAAAPAYVDALHRFGLDRADDRRFQNCARLFRVWMEEMRRQSATLPRVYDGPTLLGGWNFVELAEGSPIRWTSAESLVDVGDGAQGLAITGYAPRRTTLEVRRGEATATRTVEGRFEWTVELAGTSPVTAIRTESTFAAEDDPRELGVLVRELAVRQADAWRSVDLGRDFETVWRSTFAREWVSSLCATAEARERSDDDLFIAVRGPHSTDLGRWLEDNLATYDVVLAQGVPFATLVHVAEIASRRRVPIVLLPHFHMEDRYYHWRRYYDAFRAADCVIAAPSQSKPIFFDPLAANSVALPGGGVDVHEFEPDRLAAGRTGFRALHGSETPFVLVLGRKAGAKNYRIAIEAAARVNAREHRVDLILIGPDEDGIPVDAEHVYCYGARSARS